MTASAGPRRATGTPSLTAEASNELLVVRSAPRNSISSAISSADRAPAPSSNIAAVRLANPNFPLGSSLAPDFKSSVTARAGPRVARPATRGRHLTACASGSQAASAAAWGPAKGAGSIRLALRSHCKSRRDHDRQHQTPNSQLHNSQRRHRFSSGSTTSSTRRSAGAIAPRRIEYRRG